MICHLLKGSWCLTLLIGHYSAGNGGGEGERASGIRCSIPVSSVWLTSRESPPESGVNSVKARTLPTSESLGVCPLARTLPTSESLGVCPLVDGVMGGPLVDGVMGGSVLWATQYMSNESFGMSDAWRLVRVSQLSAASLHATHELM